jgi:hypothetical protein
MIGKLHLQLRLQTPPNNGAKHALQTTKQRLEAKQKDCTKAEKELLPSKEDLVKFLRISAAQEFLDAQVKC